MANRILGLIGPGKGPWINTMPLRDNPRAKIVGLLTGKVTVRSAHAMEVGAEYKEMEITECGLHSIHSAPYMQVEYDGPDLIVCTLHGAKVAVP